MNDFQCYIAVKRHSGTEVEYTTYILEFKGSNPSAGTGR
jgi:hypothetical protein